MATELAAALRARRVEPVLKHLAGVKALYVSATGPMAGVPVEVLAPEFTVSYTPSGTVLARLKDRPKPTGEGVLAVGDPVFTRPTEKSPAAPLPPGGVLVTYTDPAGPAAKAGIRVGDVLLRYGKTDVTDADGFRKAVAATGEKTVPLLVWRADQPTARTVDVPAGKLGVVLATDPAPVALADRRKVDAILASRGDGWSDLPGTRVELNRLKTLFGDKATVLSDSAASEQGLDALRRSGVLAKSRFLHLATHGQGNTVRALESCLILAQDRLPGDPVAKDGQPLLNGRLTAREVLDFWTLDAELVTLSACETAVGVKAGGDGLLGFAQAFLTAGSRSVCLSLWKVDDTATALLMDRFYHNLLGKRDGLKGPMGKSASLAEAKEWPRTLTADEALKLAGDVTQGVVRGPNERPLKLETPKPENDDMRGRPFAHPKYWAAFILVGDPD